MVTSPFLVQVCLPFATLQIVTDCLSGQLSKNDQMNLCAMALIVFYAPYLGPKLPSHANLWQATSNNQFMHDYNFAVEAAHELLAFLLVDHGVRWSLLQETELRFKQCCEDLEEQESSVEWEWHYVSSPTIPFLNISSFLRPEKGVVKEKAAGAWQRKDFEEPAISRAQWPEDLPVFHCVVQDVHSVGD